MRRPQHAPVELRCVPRSPPSHRRASDAAVPPRSRPRGAPRQARLRRILVRRASLQRLGDDRLARDVPGRGGRADQADQARHRRRLPALSPSVQRRPAHGAARLHDGGTRDLRLRPRCAGLGRPYPRHRPHAAAGSPGRGHRYHPPPDARRAPYRQVRLVHPAGRRPPALALQEDMPFAVASQISPSGMTLAGKHGIGIISLGSLSEEGLNNLPTQWSFAEAAAAEHGQTIDRKNWRVLMSWHIAETRERARAEAREGLLRHHNEYITATLQRPGARAFKDPDEAVNKTAFVPGAVATIGTPDDLVERIKSVLEISGGFGTVVGFVHDWANPENTMRSWDMVARYVVPEINGYLAGLRASREFVANNREY